MSVRYIAGPDAESFHVDEDGICEPVWRIGKLKWQEIREVFLKREGDREYVCILVRDRPALRARLGIVGRIFSAATRAAGCGDLSINAKQRRIRASEVVEFGSEMITHSLTKKRPNKSPEPTAMSVTPPAAQEPRQP